jgi:hypothetical protein
VKLFVGIERREFTVHKRLLCDRSSFFAGAFSTGFKEAITGIIELPEDDPASMALLVDFLYRGSLPDIDEQYEKTNKDGLEEYTSMEVLLKLYYLAEKLCMSNLMNQIMDKIRHWHQFKKKLFGTGTPVSIYNNTHEKSKLRLYAAAQFARCLHDEALPTLVDANEVRSLAISPDFFRNVVQFQLSHWTAMAVLKRWPDDPETGGFGVCEFHVHEKNEVCGHQGKLAVEKETDTEAAEDSSDVDED